MDRTLDRLPSYLRAYCTEHDTSKYTARDHAAWRYIMRRSMDFFKDHAVSSYRDGFKKSGLRIDQIPHIDQIDQALQEFGWGAVPVVGFIAPWAFIEFQSRKILPIATDMRSVEHIAYTPAPDIVHEAAGHAPIIPDKEYSDYLAYYASLGLKAIYSKQDLMVYEAVRYLSDIKEKPESTAQQIANAEIRLKETLKSFTYTSEQALVARMSWWTAEYGMAGSLQKPKIFGAGLLSSVGESKLAVTDKVKKIRLSLDCINYSYNITEPQPQLFVAENMQHLTDILHELDQLLAYRQGGIDSLKKALDAEAITTLCLDSKIAVSGQVVGYKHKGPKLDFVKYKGPVQISFAGKQLLGQGVSRHAEGFSSPIGRAAARPDKALSAMGDRDLQDLGLELGRVSKLRFVSGFEVEGRVLRLHREQGQLILITFGDCTVRQGGEIYFDPAWGEFDMIVGDEITSVYGGPADREPYGEHEITQTETVPARQTPYSDEEVAIFANYQKLRNIRRELDSSQLDAKTKILHFEDLARLAAPLRGKHEWLLQLEIYELLKEKFSPAQLSSAWVEELARELEPKQQVNQDTAELLDEGLRLLPKTSAEEA